MSHAGERIGTWRRAGDELRHTGAAAALPLTDVPFALADAADRVLRQPESWAGDALNFEEAETRLHELLEATRTSAEALNTGLSAGERVLQQRLLDMLRAELLTAHMPGADAAADAALLETLQRLELVRRALEPAWHQMLPARLAGADGPSLIVEVAHDLRSPLTSIMFLAETLRKGRSGPVLDPQRKQLGIIYSAALGLSTIVTDVIALVRDGDIDREVAAPFSVAEVFDSVCDMVRPLAEEKALQLCFTGPEDDARIGNAVALGRVLLNLVTNALKFTETGYVEVTARGCGGSCVEFSVLDSGRGMDSEMKESLYRPFQRASYRHGFRFSGTGLGLSICRRTIESLGGELHYEPGQDGGTRFYFQLELPKASRY